MGRFATSSLRRFGALAIAATLVAACQLIAGLKPPERVDAGPVDASAEDGHDGSPRQEWSACGPTPPVPTVPVPEGKSTIALVFGYLTIQPESPDAGVELCPINGFDLDDKQTCFVGDARVPEPCPGDAGCASSCTSTAPRPQLCDAPGGIDNAVGAALNGAGVLAAAAASQFDPNTALRAAADNIIIEVMGYNELSDDPDVTVAFLLSGGLEDRSAVFAPGESDSGAIRVGDSWDGTTKRRWTVDPASLRFDVPAKTSAGYVSNNVLVVSSTTLTVPVGVVGGASVQLENARLSGELRRRGSDWEIVRGRLGGRVSTTAIVETMARVPFAGPGGTTIHLCDNQGAGLDVVREMFCPRADLVGSDGVGTCSGISVGMGFVAVPAEIGVQRARPARQIACDLVAIVGCDP